MSKYVTIYEEYKHKFFQLPKVFFTNEKYQNMSNNAKVAWSILRDRSSLSRKNEWFDRDTGKIYFNYKNKKLMEILNIKSETTLVKIKEELESAELIEQQRIGFNRPNKIYLLYPIIEEKDVYEIDRMEDYQSETAESENSPQSQEKQGTSKNGAPKNEVPYPQKMEPSNTELSDTDFKDLDTLDTGNGNMNNAENKEKKRERLIQKARRENNSKIPEQLAEVLNTFSNSEDEENKYYKIILQAKNKASLEVNLSLTYEDYPELANDISNIFIRSLQRIQKSNDIINPNGYIYNAITQSLIEKYKIYDAESNSTFNLFKEIFNQ